MQISNEAQNQNNYNLTRSILKRYAFLDDQLDLPSSNTADQEESHPSSPAARDQPRNYDWLLSSSPSEHNSPNSNTSFAQSFQTPARSMRLSQSFNSSGFSYSNWLSPSQIKQRTSGANNTSVKPKRLRKHAQLQQNECAICLSQVSNRSDLKCGHFYCFDCLQQWLNNSNSCPYCRTEIAEFTCDGVTHKVAPKEFVYEPSNDEVMDWLCYRCSHTEQGDIVLICDRCGAYACHIECDETLGGVEPEGEWYCHQCR